jgi:hypothetical protein
MKFFNKTFFKFVLGFLVIVAIGVTAIFFLGVQDTSMLANPVIEQ